MSDLRNFNIKTPLFSFNGFRTEARVVNVIDGDTIAVVFSTFNQYYKFHLRINGIDTCEIHSKNEILKTKALKAKNRMIDLLYAEEIMKKEEVKNTKEIIDLFEKKVCIIWLECLEFDKYGRLLGNIFITDKKINVANVLLKENLAYEYHGGKKEDFPI